jgi:hypothetical protein
MSYLCKNNVLIGAELQPDATDTEIMDAQCAQIMARAQRGWGDDDLRCRKLCNVGKVKRGKE